MGDAGTLNMQQLFESSRQAFSADATVSLPGAEPFDKAIARMTAYEAPGYSASIAVTNEADIQAAVKLANANNIPFLATSGGHGFSSSLSALKEGLQIDLTRMKQIDVDTKANTVTVDPGALFGDLWSPLYEHGKEISTGSCSSTSVIGVTIGGGVGRYQTYHGLLVDQLISARVVLASGDVVNASTTENSDLFWGIRGAGPHLGIITQAVFRTADLTNNGEIQVADMLFSLDVAEPFFAALKELESTKPHGFIVTIYVFFNPGTDTPVILANFMYPGPSSILNTHIEPFLALNPLTTDIRPLRWNRLIHDALFGLDALQTIKNQSAYAGGLCLKHVDTEPLLQITRDLAKVYEEYPAARMGTLWLIEWWDNSVVRKVKNEATAYAWRDTEAYLMVSGSWPPSLSPSDPAAVAARKWAREAKESCGKTSGYGEKKTFATYADGSERPEQVFGGNLERVREVKRKWDPENRFRFAGDLGL